MKNSSQIVLLTLPLSFVGCVAMLGGQNDTEDGADQASLDPEKELSELSEVNDVDCSKVPVDPGERPLKMLTRQQYLNTLGALFGNVPGVTEALPAYLAPSTLGVPQAHVNGNEIEGYQRAAHVVAAHVVGRADLMSTLAPCDSSVLPMTSSVASECASNFIRTFGGSAYRSPVVDQEDVDNHLGPFRVGFAVSYERGIEMVLAGILQSPRFLYQVEIGTSDHVSTGAVKLRPHEMAARLSYAIWNTKPDERLLAAVASGELDTPEGVLTQLKWMVDDPRGADFVRGFLEAWTHLDKVKSLAKDEVLYPKWPEMQGATHAQGRAFFDHILKNEGGSLHSLLTSPTVMVNSALAEYYGVSAGEDFAPFEPAKGTPSGLLTLPALLSTLAKLDETSPIHRGVFIREALLCQQPPAPPADIPQPPAVDSGGSTRERLAQHVSEESCRGCHELFDPVGLGLESYDAVGLYREMDGGKPVDATGEILGTDVDGEFDGAVELGERLADSELVEQCVARQWFRYALGRFEQDADVCSLQALVNDFSEAEQSLNKLPEAVVQTSAFLYRRPSDAEIAP